MNRERLYQVIDLLLDMGEHLRARAPQEALAHFRAARRESLLGVRTLVDHALQRLDSEEQQRSEERARSIPLE
jgi:hypothetical protein